MKVRRKRQRERSRDGESIELFVFEILYKAYSIHIEYSYVSVSESVTTRS